MTSEDRIEVPSVGGPDGGTPEVEHWLAEHLPSLNAFVRMRTGAKLGARESISDLVQSTCREAIGALEKVPEVDESGFKYWLFTLAERKIRKRVRYWEAEKRDRAHEAGGMSVAERQQLLRSYHAFHRPSHGAEVDDELARVEAAMHELPEDQREVILLHHLLELPHREIALRMDRSEAAVRQLLSKALARLLRILKTREGDATS